MRFVREYKDEIIYPTYEYENWEEYKQHKDEMESMGFEIFYTGSGTMQSIDKYKILVTYRIVK